jgi:2-aminoethylphosphonate dioxygenase
MKTPILTQAQLSDFKRDGFLIIRGMYSVEEMKTLGRWIDDLAARPSEAGKQMAYYEKNLLDPNKKILSRIEKFVEYDENLRNFIYAEKMMGRVADLLGEPGVLFKEKINFKLPGGGGFEPHQDIQPAWDDYASYFLSVLVTVDPSTIQNGCLELAAGHHTRGMIGRKWKPLEGAELYGIEFKHYPMEPGDVAFFDCFVPHQSKPNLTDKPRRNLYLTLNRQSEGDHREKYFSDKRKSFPPDFEREPGKEYVFRV